MSNMIEVQETGDITYTMCEGQLRAWKVLSKGDFLEVEPRHPFKPLPPKAAASMSTLSGEKVQG